MNEQIQQPSGLKIPSHHLNEVIERYSDYKKTLQAIDKGDWKNNNEIQKLSPSQIENMRFIVEQLEQCGFRTIAKLKRKSIH